MRTVVLSLALALSASTLAQSTPDSRSAPAEVQTRKIGGSVLPPTLEHQVEPKNPKSLPGRSTSSHVVLRLVVDVQGMPTNIHVVQTGGADFDKNAITAVEQYRFKPATEDGKPVPVEVNIDVQFHIFQR